MSDETKSKPCYDPPLRLPTEQAAKEQLDHWARAMDAQMKILADNYATPSVFVGVDMAKPEDEGGYTVVRKHNVAPSAPPADLRPTHGYIQHLSRIPDGERWPVLTFRVLGGDANGRRDRPAILTRDGVWRWFEGYAFVVPEECNLSQSQLGDALSAAGIGPGLPWENLNYRNAGAAPITYVEPVTRPASALREEWTPKAPKWRGGKPWR